MTPNRITKLENALKPFCFAVDLPKATPAVVAVDECEGWTNRETWLVNLWLNNESTTYHAALQIAESHPDASDPWIGEAIESEVFAGMIDDAPSGFIADILNAFRARVAWDEIGASFRESAQ